MSDRAAKILAQALWDACVACNLEYAEIPVELFRHAATGEGDAEGMVEVCAQAAKAAGIGLLTENMILSYIEGWCDNDVRQGGLAGMQATVSGWCASTARQSLIKLGLTQAMEAESLARTLGCHVAVVVPLIKA